MIYDLSKIYDAGLDMKATPETPLKAQAIKIFALQTADKSERLAVLYDAVSRRALGVLAKELSPLVSRVVGILSRPEEECWLRSRTVEAMYGVPYVYVTTRGAAMLSLEFNANPDAKVRLQTLLAGE